MPRQTRIPSYRLHKQSGQAVVTLTDGLGRRRDVLLRYHGTPESRVEYARVIAEWEANGRRLPASEATTTGLSVNELALANWTFAEAYYGFDKRKGTAFNIRDAIRILRQLYGHSPAADFGPLALKACRVEMVKKECVSGRSKPATYGHLKTSHFEETQYRPVGSPVQRVVWGTCHVESAPSGRDRHHPVPASTRLVPTLQHARTRRPPRDRRTLPPPTTAGAKTGHCAHRLPGPG
jgi:hypothetical protein